MTKIEWTHRPGTKGESWNMIGGCTKVSPACDHCYALSMSWRLQNNPKRPERYGDVAAKVLTDHVYKPVKEQLHWTGRVNLDYDALEIPYRWKKPRTVFVASMADLFHEQVPDEFIARAFAVMKMSPNHTFLVLTKRAQRMKEWFDGCQPHMTGMVRWKGGIFSSPLDKWPVENIWLGVTAEDQEQANVRIPLLLQTPAAVRWVSVEPMLGAIDIEQAIHPDTEEWLKCPTFNDGCYCLGSELHWVVIGAESGPNRRWMDNQWAISLVAQCDDAQVPVFVKQVHTNRDWRDRRNDKRVSKDLTEWPGLLRRREWPR